MFLVVSLMICRCANRARANRILLRLVRWRLHDSEINIEKGWLVRISRSLADKKSYPDTKTKYRITKPDWEDLQSTSSIRKRSRRSLGGSGVPGAWTKWWSGLRCSSATGRRRWFPTTWETRPRGRSAVETDSRHQGEAGAGAEVRD
jgi:hypothetical protein